MSVRSSERSSEPSSGRTGRTRRPAATDVTIDERFIEVDGVRLRVRVAGTGDPLLLITGIGASLELAEPFETEMVTRGFRVISFDAPGVGQSTGYSLPPPDARHRPHHRASARRPRSPAGRRAGRVTRRGHRPATRPPGTRPGAPAGLGRDRRRGVRPRWHPRLSPGPAGNGHPPPLPLPGPLPTGSPDASTAAAPARTPTRCCTTRVARFAKPPSLAGYLGQLYALSVLDRAALAAPARPPHPRAAPATTTPSSPPSTAASSPGSSPTPGCTSCAGGGHLFILERPSRDRRPDHGFPA